MEITIAEQTTAFFGAMLLGAAGALLYGVFSAIRLLNARGRILSLLLDLFFFLFMSVITFLFFLAATDGRARAYLYLGELFGGTLTWLTVGRIWKKILNQLLQWLRRFFRWSKKRTQKMEKDIFEKKFKKKV